MIVRITQHLKDLSHDVELVVNQNVFRLGAKLSLEEAKRIRQEISDSLAQDFLEVNRKNVIHALEKANY